MEDGLVKSPISGVAGFWAGIRHTTCIVADLPKTYIEFFI